MVDRRGPHRQARNRQAADDSQKWIGGQQTSEHEVENHPHQRDDAQQPGIPVDIVIDDGGIGIKVLENRALDELIPLLEEAELHQHLALKHIAVLHLHRIVALVDPRQDLLYRQHHIPALGVAPAEIQQTIGAAVVDAVIQGVLQLLHLACAALNAQREILYFELKRVHQQLSDVLDRLLLQEGAKRPLCGLLDNCVAPHLPHPQGAGQHFIAVEQLQHDLVLSSGHTVLGDQLLHRGKKDTVRAAPNPLFLPELSPVHR